nr:hypothetical protein [uncultured Shewanella sp.]
MQNIELFNLATKEILGMCYESFPNRVSFKHFDITEKVLQYYELSDFKDKENDVAKVCLSTAKWLRQANYIWVEHELGNEFNSVTLTPKAFELLNLMPESLKAQESIGSMLMNGAMKTSKAGALAVVRVMLSEGVKMMS